MVLVCLPTLGSEAGCLFAPADAGEDDDDEEVDADNLAEDGPSAAQ